MFSMGGQNGFGTGVVDVESDGGLNRARQYLFDGHVVLNYEGQELLTNFLVNFVVFLFVGLGIDVIRSAGVKVGWELCFHGVWQ